jgi:phosphate transport system substrate-binding protein
MNEMIKKFLTAGLILALAVGTFTGCAPKEASSGAEVTGKVVIAGSTSVQPLSEELAAAFMDINPGISVEVQGGGSGVGIKAATDKIADFGASSRNLKDEEKANITDEYVIAKDGIAVIANADSPVNDLTLVQIQKIFTGEITNWKEVGGPDAAIVVVSREEGSGTRGAFIEITKVLVKDASGNETDKTTINALVQPSTGAVKQTVDSTPNSIGYASIGAVDETVKSIKVEGIEATEANVLKGDYLISRPFIYIGNGPLSEAAQLYLDFVMSPEGQDIVALDFIPVN